MKFDFIVVGNNVAALVAAETLSEKYAIGFLNPTPAWGAHFGGTTIEGEPYDLGMNFLEFTSFNAKSDDLSTYNPLIKNDCGRFFHFVKKYVSDRISVREIATPQMFVQGQYMSDGIVANNFGDLRNLPSEIREKMIGELERALLKSNPLHASQKRVNEDLFMHENYRTVSIANHGETFHDLFIEPLCGKILNVEASRIPALFHRIAWAPLLYPETLLAFLKTGEGRLPKTSFHYPTSGHFGILCETLIKRIEQKNNVTIVREKLLRIDKKDGWRIHLANNDSMHAKKFVWAMDLAQYLKLTGEPEQESFEKTSIAIVFVKLSSNKLKRRASALTIIDNKHAVYRITNQTYSSGQDNETSKIVLEINYNFFMKAFPGATEADVTPYAIGVLRDLGLIENDSAILSAHAKVLMNVLNLPTLDNFNKFEKMRNTVVGGKNDDLVLLAQSSGYVSTSLNDQIVQGLKMGALFN